MAKSTPPSESPYAFFYSCQPGAANFNNGFMSPNNRSPVQIPGGLKYTTMEQGYQHAKALILAKYNCEPNVSTPPCTVKELPDLILGLTTLADFKGTTHAFNWTQDADEEWQLEIRRSLYRLNFYKFRDAKVHADDGGIRAKLLATGDKYLVQTCGSKKSGSKYDICSCACGTGYHADIVEQHRSDWNANLLGKVLMHIRGQLREAELTGRPLPDLTPEMIAEVSDIYPFLDDGRS